MARDFGFPPASDPEYYFISYNSEDAERIAPIARRLRDTGIPVWYDRGLVYGEKWEEQITERLAHAKAVILFFTRGILYKPESYVKKECRIATRLFHKKVYVVMLDEVSNAEVPLSMAAWWNDIQEWQNIVAVDSVGMTVACILQALGMPGSGNEAAPTPAAAEESDGLPERVSLFEMLGIRNIDEFDIEKHWAAADLTASIAVPVGLGCNAAVVQLDLHQRKDGPNGIIAGPNRTGKSEFLYTLLLSLALHYSPQHVRLHIVDPIQQPQFLALLSLPHTGVSLNQLSDTAFERLLTCFDQEAASRASLLAQYGVQNIYQYLKRAKSDPAMPPMPHLVVAIDSFEMLKRMNPWETKQLLSWGTTENARKFGFHLILATSRPAGVIDDSLYLMTQFKIFTDAASGTARPGRLCLQTPAHDSLQLLQLAYSSEKASAAFDDNPPDFIDFFRSKTQLQTIIQAIERCCLD